MGPHACVAVVQLLEQDGSLPVGAGYSSTASVATDGGTSTRVYTRILLEYKKQKYTSVY